MEGVFGGMGPVGSEQNELYDIMVEYVYLCNISNSKEKVGDFLLGSTPLYQCLSYLHVYSQERSMCFFHTLTQLIEFFISVRLK